MKLHPQEVFGTNAIEIAGSLGLLKLREENSPNFRRPGYEARLRGVKKEIDYRQVTLHGFHCIRTCKQ